VSKKAQVQIELEEGGRVLSPFNSLVIVQHVDWHHSFELRLPMSAFTGNEDTFSDTCEKVIGKPIKIGLRAQNGSQQDDNFFKGIITDISMSRYHGASSEVVISGYSPTILLEDGVNTRSFTEMSPADIAKSVIGDYPQNLIKSNLSPKTVQIPYIVQYQESNYHYLSRLAQRFGEWFFYDGAKLNFGRPEDSSETDLILGKDLINFDLGLKIKPVNFKLKSYDYLKNETYESSSSSASVQGLNAFGNFLSQASEDVFNQSPLLHARPALTAKSELDDIALRRKSYQSNEFVKLSGVSDNIAVKIGTTVNISASWGDILRRTQEEYQKYLVIGVTHRIDGDGNYQNQFEAIPSSLQLPPQNPHVRQPFAEAQPAVVVDNNDPDKLGRAKVKFYWQEGETPWIRWAQPHAGAKNGFYFLPEVNDEVIVNFIQGDPDRPIIVGNVYHEKAKPSDEWPNPDNYIKAIKTQSGNEIRFNDESGKEEIKIFNPDSKNEITLSLSGNGSISISSQGDISISAEGSLTMTAEEISMTSRKKTSIDCDEMETNAQKNIKVSSGQAYSLDSGTKMAISSGTDYELSAGMNAKVSSKMNLDISAGINGKFSATANLDAQANAMLNLKGTAMVNVQGAMVKLN